MTRKTVLHFTQDGDTSGYFPQMARWHDRQRYRMLFGSLGKMPVALRDYMISQGVECFSCDCLGRLSYPRAILRLAKYLRSQHVDVLHTHLYEPSIVGLLAGKLAGVTGLAMTRHHSNYLTRINKTWHVRLDQMCTNLAGTVIAVSKHTAQHMVEVESAPADKVKVILNGIDFDRVKVSNPDAIARIRKEFGVAKGMQLIVVVGRLQPEKGHSYLFRALPGLRRRVNSPFRVVVAGAGPFESQYRSELRELKCDDIVHLAGFRNDAPDIIAAADLFVLPSVAEAFGLVLAEAMYLGACVISTRVGGIPEIIDHGVNGILVPPADSEALSDTIADLLNHPEKRRTFTSKGQQKVRSQFSFERMVREYEAVYQSLLTEPVK